MIRHSAVDELMQLVHIIPSTFVVTLEGFYPVEHAGDPFQFLVFSARAYYSRVLAKVDIGVSAVTTVVCSTLTKEVVQFAKIANSRRLYNPPSPPTTPLHIRPPIPIWHCPRIIIPPGFLVFVHITTLWRIRPRIVTRVRIIPYSSAGIFFLGSAEQGSRGTVPLGMRCCSDGHFGIDLAFHVPLVFRTAMVLITLAELSTRVREGVRVVVLIPRILVARVVLNGFLHALADEGGDIGESVEVAIGGVGVAEVEVLPGDAVLDHDAQAGDEPLVTVDRGGYRTLVEEERVVDDGLLVVKDVEYPTGCGFVVFVASRIGRTSRSTIRLGSLGGTWRR
mmetsp:Transcript_13189/g.28473  ORF Transcript_13189/g.28473 Transcript_13189/m.28473 type:complete len:336 (+) Transcript_13189:198-1205(+)